MFGIFDIIWSIKTRNKVMEFLEDREEFTKFSRMTIKFSDKKVLWVCYPGFFKVNTDLKREWGSYNLLPKEGTVIVYSGPYSIAGDTPQLTNKTMEKLEDDMKHILDEHDHLKDSLSVFGFSAGTFPAYYFANKCKAKKLIALAPGPHMGEGIYTSIFTPKLKERCVKNGYPTHDDYDKIIARYNQENNISDLPKDNVMIFAGKFDHVIINNGTKKIAKMTKDAGKNVYFRNYSMFGHVTLAMWIGFLNKIGKDPYNLNK